MDTENKLSSCLGWVVAWLVLLVVSVTMNGWALSTVWNWFMPAIFGLASLTMMQAIGVSLVFSLFTGTNRISKKDPESERKTSLEKFISASLEAVATPVIYVGIAYIYLQFAF